MISAQATDGVEAVANADGHLPVGSGDDDGLRRDGAVHGVVELEDARRRSRAFYGPSGRWSGQGSGDVGHTAGAGALLATKRWIPSFKMVPPNCAQ